MTIREMTEKVCACVCVCLLVVCWYVTRCSYGIRSCVCVCVCMQENGIAIGCLLVCHRMFIWRKILCLPENHAAYGALVDKGVHSAYDNLHKAYPIKSSKLLRILQRLVLLHIICTQTLSSVHMHHTLMHAGIHALTLAHTHTHTHCMHAHTHTHRDTHTHTHTRTHVCAHTCMHACTHTRMLILVIVQ